MLISELLKAIRKAKIVYIGHRLNEGDRPLQDKVWFKATKASVLETLAKYDYVDFTGTNPIVVDAYVSENEQEVYIG